MLTVCDRWEWAKSAVRGAVSINLLVMIGPSRVLLMPDCCSTSTVLHHKMANPGCEMGAIGLPYHRKGTRARQARNQTQVASCSSSDSMQFIWLEAEELKSILHIAFCIHLAPCSFNIASIQVFALRIYRASSIESSAASDIDRLDKLAPGDPCLADLSRNSLFGVSGSRPLQINKTRCACGLDRTGPHTTLDVES